MKLGRFAEKDPQAQSEADEKEKAEADAIPVGSRCEISLPKAVPRRGTVMYVG